MGVHVEWMDARYTSAGVIEAGAMWDGEIAAPADRIGEDVVNDGNIAVSIGGDAATIIEGTPERLHTLFADILAKIEAARYAALPTLPDPVAADDEEHDDEEHDVTCPYVYTEADAERARQHNAEYVARMREMHGDDAHVYEQPVPVPGEVCGAELNLWDKDPVRRSLYTRGGMWIAGPSSYADDGGGDEEVMCGNLHEFQVPDIDDWQ